MSWKKKGCGFFLKMALLSYMLDSCSGCGERDQAPSQRLVNQPQRAPVIVPQSAAIPCNEGLSDLPEFEAEASVEVEARVNADRSVRFAYRTNLPQGARLMLRLRGTEYRGDSSIEVSSPCAISTVFAADGLSVGEYTLTVRTPVGAVQPVAVQVLFGEGGANLQGPLVVEHDGEQVVETSLSFTVGSVEASNAAESQRASERVAIRNRLRNLVRMGREMRALRRSGNERACGNRMRELQADVASAMTDANRVGDDFLGRIGRSARMCVSCSRSALESCGFAEEFLSDWENINQEWLTQ